MSNLFISHSSRDSAAAKQLQARLEEQGHHSVFLDLDPEAGIQAGVSWERTLYTKLRACRAVVALCSDSYLASQWCFAEIALARMEGKELFVLQIDPWSENTQMPSILTEEQYIDLRTNQDDGYQRLWNGFKVKGIMAAEAREWKPEEPPYPGLRAFREEDAPIFFGRDEEIREGGELLNRVRRQGHPRLVMVLGSSGSGKSSLVRAGIVPQLRRDRGQWRVVKPFRPGRQPARELAASLSQAFDEAGQTFAWEEIHRWLEPAADGDLAAPAAVLPATAEAEPSPAAARERLLQALSAMEGELTAADDQVVSSVRRLKDYLGQQQTETPLPSGGAPPPPVASPLAELASRLRLQSGFAEATVVLVIDQFEELLGHDAKHPASRFLAMLRAAMETEDSPFLVIGTMRSDYLGVLQRSAPLQGFGFKSLSVGPLSRDGMRQIIEEPAKLGQIQLENGLSDLLLEDTETSDALPLLAFTLRMMWDRYRDKRLLEIREYKELGGLQGAVAQVADETLETALTLGEERDLRDAFLSLARPTAEGSGWARQATNWEDLAEQVRPMLQEFIDQRLLVKRADCTVEVAHEALFRSWEKLRGWLNANAEGLRLLHEIQIDAAKWETATMDREREPYLWRGGRLTRAVELRDAGVLALNDLNRSFIEASERSERERIDAETARQRRELRRTRIFAAFIAAALVVVVLGFFKIQRQARHTLSRQLAAQSHQLLDHQPDLALLIALAAGRVEKTLDAQRALLAAVQYNPRLWRYLHGPGDPIRSVAISADGSILAAVVEGDGGGGSILLWSVDNGLPLASSPLALPEMADPVAAFSPDGRWLAVGGVDRQEWEKGLLDLWDMGSDPPRRRDGPSPEGAVNDLAFCGQQKSILAWATKNRRVFLWRPDDDAERVSLLHKEIDIRRLAFAPDCTCLAVGHEETGSIDFIELGSTHLPETAAGEAPETRQGASTVCPKETLRGPNSEDRILTTQGSTQGVISLAFAPTGDAVAAARMDGTVDLWDLNSASCETLSEPAGPVEAVAYDSDRTLLSAGRDGAILLWNLRESPAASERLPGHAGKVTGLAYGRGGGLFASGGEDGKVILWKLDRRQRLANILKGHEDEVLAAAFDPDGGRLVSGGAGPTVKLWELDTGDWADLKGNTGVTSGVDFSSDGMLVVAGGEDGSLHLWHLGDEKKNLHWFAEGRRPVASVRFNPAESTLATAVDDQIVLWDFGVELSTPTPSEPTVLKPPLATHPADIWSLLYRDGGGSIVASDTGGGAVLVWNLKTRESRSFFPAHGSKEPVLTAIAQSANGNLLAAGGDDRCVHLWEMSGDKPSECLAGHELPVLAVAFGPGDRTLFSADRGGTLLVWDVASRQPLGGLRDGHESGKPINNLALGKRGNLASVADDKNIAIWDLDWQAVACDVARRDMKYEEWQVYLEDTARRNLCPVFDRTVPAASPNRRMRKQERRSE